ncbi:methyl-accepting chemotaxis protein [Fusibacter paucivorans]|uniref:Methyl-accepting chemotaxis protein n=1 Tax=Fusibacter paucivorans TaxID=76009 RepID=A0ABS5PSZ0_9FIRM|nr:methyl-accepting chemotaxis protein [Fusibacter paucivorans]MBS7528268.1 methyl-accepting chemotaxis protein [Fusibacter paucivorans]
MARKNNGQKKEIKWHISTKIIIAIIVTSLVAQVVTLGAVTFIVNENVGNQATMLGQNQILANSSKIDQSFLEIETLAKAISAEVAIDVDINASKADIQVLRDLCDTYEVKLAEMGKSTMITNSIYIYFNSALFGDVADCWVYGDDFKRQPMIDLDYYNEPHEWFDLPVKDGKTMWTFPYMGTTETTKGQLITSFVTPIIKNGVTVGMVGMDLNLKDVQESLNQIQLYDTGYLYMIDSNGDVITHPTIQWEDSDGDGMNDTKVNIKSTGDYQFLIDEFNNNQDGFTSYTRFDGKEVFSAYDHLSNGWIVAASVPRDEVMRVIQDLFNIMLTITIAIIIIAAILAFFVGKSISNPIIKVVEATSKIKEGDFTIQVGTKSSDETKLLANAINDMTNNIRSLVGESQKVSSEMVESAATLAAMSEETTATVDQVASAIDDISKGSQNTAEEAEKSTVIVNVIDEKFDFLMKNSEMMQQYAEHAIESNKMGSKTLATLKEKSEIGKMSNEKIATAVINLDKKTNDITDIIATITSIASQTNLLALNASIEAARAGEAGRGFAVVADEIRKLAENSSMAADEIQSIINSIQIDSRQTVLVMDEVKKINDEQSEAVEDVSTSFTKIFESVESITKEFDKVTSELNELNRSKNDIVMVTNNISAVSEETAAATEEVNASMSEQSKAIEEVAKNAEKLNELSRLLSDHIKVFKIK